MTKQAEQIIVDTTGDENDDWMQKSAPDVYVMELKIHEEMAAQYAKEQAAKNTPAKQAPARKL